MTWHGRRKQNGRRGVLEEVAPGIRSGRKVLEVG
jgi:hypothetical protein